MTYCAGQDGLVASRDDQDGQVVQDDQVVLDSQVSFHVDQDGRVASHAFAVQVAYHVALGAYYAGPTAFPGPLASVLDLSLASLPLAF